MGKKQGEAARVKGNAKPSSSAKAAEMLQQVRNAFDIPPIGVGTLMEDSFDTNVDPDFRMVLKKLYKKDTLTKVKSLEELKTLIEAKSQEDCLAIVSYWAKSYTKLTIDNDRKIRELCQQTHEKLCSKVNKHLAPYLKTIMPYWLLAQSDNHSIAARTAESSFKTTFNELKQPEVVYFTKDEILNVLHDFLIVQTAKTLSDMKNTSEDEALQKFENVLSMSLRALGIFVKYFFGEGSKFLKEPTVASLEKLEKILTDQKFWKYSRENNLKIRSDFYQLQSQLIDFVLLNNSLIELEKLEPSFKFTKTLKAKIIPLVFYACDEDNQTCCFYVWQSILKCLNRSDLLDKYEENNSTFWNLINVKKAFLPKLIALMRNHGNGNANSQNVEIIFPSLSLLVNKLVSNVYTQDSLEEKILFYKDFSSKIFDSISKDTNAAQKTRFIFASNRVKIINAFFDTYSFIYEDLICQDSQTGFEFCEQVLLNNVLKLYELYLEGGLNDQTNAGEGFEYKFQKFLNMIVNTDRSGEKLRENFLEGMSSILLKKFEKQDQTELDSTERYLNVSKSFCTLFQPLWSLNLNKSKEKIDSLVQVLFEFFLQGFQRNLDQNSSETNRITYLYLTGLCELASNFPSEKNLDLFLNHTPDHSSSINLEDKLNIFNEKFIKSLIEKCLQKNIVCVEENVLNGVIELYLFVNLKINSTNNPNLKLDDYLFDTNLDNQREQLELFLKSYLQKCKSNKIHKILRETLNEWIMQSEKLQDFLLNKYLNNKNLYLNTKFAFDLIETLIKHNSGQETIEKFFQSFLQTNIGYMKSIDLESKQLDLNEINQFLEFNSNLLFNLNEKLAKKFLDLELFWSILLNYLTLKSSLKLEETDQIDLNLKSSIKKLINLLFSNFSNEQDLLSCFKPFSEFINSSLKMEHLDLNQVIQELTNEIAILKGAQFVDTLYKTILLKQKFNFADILETILFPNQTVNSDLMLKVYLDNRMSYLYTDQHSVLLNKPELNSEWLSVEMINKINFALTQINFYLKENKNLIGELINDQSILVSDWYYLVVCSILVEKYYLGSRETEKFRAQFKIFLNRTEFFEYLNQDQDYFTRFAGDIFAKRDLNLELCNISLLFTYLVDSGLVNFSYFSQNLMSLLISQCEPNLEEPIKLYLYDIPFAKQSILDNLESLDQNMEHYYALYTGLFESTLQKLEYFIGELKEANRTQSNENFLVNLKYFNFTLDLASKYINFYLDFVNTSSNSNALIYKLFNSNQRTLEFLKENLALYLAKIVDLFIDLKLSINSNLTALVQTLSLEHVLGGYLFYFDFSIESSNSILDWQKFLLIDKLNKFLSILFIDFKLDLDSLRYPQQLSQYLAQKHWDFILCYSSAIAQGLQNLFSNSLDERVYLQLYSISFFDLLDRLAKCLRVRVRDNKPACYPEEIYSDWNGFFSKEINDPLLDCFLELAEFYSNKSLKYSIQIALNKLGNVVSHISFERLAANDLEPRFNVLDLDLTQTKSIALNDKLKTCLNYLIPNLKHQISSIQFNSYKILRTIMQSLSEYYNTEQEEQENRANIIESLPHVIRQNLTELTDLFMDLKKTVPFEQCILVLHENQSLDDQDLEPSEKSQSHDMIHEANNKIMAYLFLNKLILDMFSTNNLEFKVKLVNNLREISFCDYLMHCLFRLMPTAKFATAKMFQTLDLDELDENLSYSNELTFKNEFVEEFACKLFKYALKSVPAMIRDWWNMQPKRISDQVDRFTTKFVSPILIEEEIRQINRSANLLNSGSDLDEDQSSIKIKGMVSTREIVSTYKMKELSMELVIQLPVNHPLGVVKVSSIKRLGVSENEWRNWLLQLTTYLTHQNGSIIQGLQIWKRNVDKKFSGVEECTICYSVIHGTNYQLPKMKCRTCKHMFHSVCLYKWFESSSKSTCPLCRNLF